MVEAFKFDKDKPGLDLLPVAAKLAIAEVFDFGAKKYAKHNWRNGLDWSRLIRAAEGHIDAFNDGEDLDPESGKSHLAHAGCCILMLLESVIKGYGTDNRYNTQDINNIKLNTGMTADIISINNEIKKASDQASGLSEAGKKIECAHKNLKQRKDDMIVELNNQQHHKW